MKSAYKGAGENMKKYIIIAVTLAFWISVLFGVNKFFLGEEEKITITRSLEKMQPEENAVYVADGAKSFHKKECGYVKENYYEIEREKAEFFDLKPCKSCFPEEWKN